MLVLVLELDLKCNNLLFSLSFFQAFTCQMLTDTVACGELWSRCHSDTEIRSMKDMHISARVQQFQGNSDGIDVKQCDVVKEYIRSGRADQKSEVTKCSFAQVRTYSTRPDVSHLYLQSDQRF